ncbi:MAG: hypothetical protein WCJ74_02595, partial [bacterium]
GCGAELDEAVDGTLGDMGVEGTVVAGAVVAGSFSGSCESGYAWVIGSAKYGTSPGFCVEQDEHASSSPEGTNITQGEAKLVCQALGNNYHLISENEWLTIADNAIQVVVNDIDQLTENLQLMTWASTSVATSTIVLKLSNESQLYNIVGGKAEWTDQIITRAGLLNPTSSDWQEYSNIEDYKSLNIAPPYYYTSVNGIGRIKTGLASSSPDYLRGFVRGENALFDLDMSHSPIEATSTIGFRCAK